jgi:hypothetical protein
MRIVDAVLAIPFVFCVIVLDLVEPWLERR